MFCPHCGIPNDDDAAFCLDCGGPLEETDQEPASVALFCPHCGIQNDADAAFCLDCGGLLREGDQAPSLSKPRGGTEQIWSRVHALQDDSSTLKYVVIGGAIVLLVLLLLIPLPGGSVVGRLWGLASRGKREARNTATCVSQQQQITQAILMYSQDNGGMLPNTLEATTRYLGSASPLRCPSMTRKSRGYAVSSGYGYNTLLAGLSADRLRDSSAVSCIADGGDAWQRLATESDIDYKRHGKGYVAGFLDGHAAVYTSETRLALEVRMTEQTVESPYVPPTTAPPVPSASSDNNDTLEFAQPDESAPSPVATSRITLPNVVGFDESRARQVLEQAELQVSAITGSDRGKRDRCVLQTVPSAGEEVEVGSLIVITVNSLPRTEPSRKPLPSSPLLPANRPLLEDFTGQSGDSVVRRLRERGFVVKTSYVNTTLQSPGQVVLTEPPAGNPVRKGSKIEVVIAR
ncbi:MAG: PASTA domain-containing protein [Armatimonadota bacterium]